MSEERRTDGNVGTSGNEGTRPPVGDLAAELKPFEAALASLSPKGDRLDHDVIMFRAGQRSVAGGASGVSPARSWSMPVGLGAMTIVASVLFVMLLARPVVERVEIVRVPAVEPGATGPEEGPTVAEREPNDSNGGTELASEAASGSTQSSDRLHSRPNSRAGKMELFARMLQEDAPLSVMSEPGAAEPSGDIPQPARPVPYIERLRDILNDQARAEFGTGRPTAFFHTGADS